MDHFTLIEDAFPDLGAMDVAVSHSILSAVARGEMGGVFRLHVPGPTVAFGRADRMTPGYLDAVRAAGAHGFTAVERLVGGRAAVFHESTLAFSWAVPDPKPPERTIQRFRIISSLMHRAFQSLGIDSRIGELPGEYCPGQWSINVGNRVKVMGVGQRLVRGAAHVGGVVVVDDGHRIRDVLVPVYRSLGLDWDPRTAGSLADRSPGLDNDTVSAAIIEAFGSRFSLERGTLPGTVLDEATSNLADHLPKVA
ncbi:MAG: lipoate--protein ligase family protein [Actinobacteria bacterium]|nr:lipoate--protein ligase family protein [Actinomycetota bacterium]MCZ6567177.1 lipoate--protein ligase family protein [Actinomycetota bacterium]